MKKLKRFDEIGVETIDEQLVPEEVEKQEEVMTEQHEKPTSEPQQDPVKEIAEEKKEVIFKTVNSKSAKKTELQEFAKSLFKKDFTLKDVSVRLCNKFKINVNPIELCKNCKSEKEFLERVSKYE